MTSKSSLVLILLAMACFQGAFSARLRYDWGSNIPQISLGGGGFTGNMTGSINVSTVTYENGRLTSNVTNVYNVSNVGGGSLTGSLGSMTGGVNVSQVSVGGGSLTGSLGSTTSGINVSQVSVGGGSLTGSFGSMTNGINVSQVSVGEGGLSYSLGGATSTPSQTTSITIAPASSTTPIAASATTSAQISEGFVSLQPSNFPAHNLRHRWYEIWIDPLTTITKEGYLASATFKRVNGLCGIPGTVSFESLNFPGYYLRHENYLMWIRQNDNSKLFKDCACFHERDPLAPVSNAKSYESVNFPTYYIKHENYRVKIIRFEDTDVSRRSSSWVVVPPLAK